MKKQISSFEITRRSLFGFVTGLLVWPSKLRTRRLMFYSYVTWAPPHSPKTLPLIGKSLAGYPNQSPAVVLLDGYDIVKSVGIRSIYVFNDGTTDIEIYAPRGIW